MPARAGNGVDDAVTGGGTRAALRGAIETGGGRVIGATVLTGHLNGARIALRPETAAKLKDRYGEGLDDYLRQELGHGADLLTEGEAGHILAARNLDTLRARIAEARVQGSGPRDAADAGRAGQQEGRQGRVAADAPAAPTPPDDQGPVFDLAQAPAATGAEFAAIEKAVKEATQGWSANAPRITVVRTPADLPAAARSDPRHVRSQA